MRFKSGFRLAIFIITTILCLGIGLCIYLGVRSGHLYETRSHALIISYALLVLPFIINVVLAHAYHVTAGDFNMGVLSFVLNLAFPIIGTILNAGGFFGLDEKWYCILQIAIPLVLTYLMCLQCIIFPDEPVKSTYIPKEDNTERVIQHIRGTSGTDSELPPDPNKDADAAGLASGRGIK